jgi:uncharacterized repeat protein (TIGR01451 family)
MNSLAHDAHSPSRVRVVACEIAALTLIVLSLTRVQPARAATNSASWSVDASPSPGLDAVLYGTTVISPTDGWAVGYVNDGVTYHSLSEHWDGSSWTVVPSPNEGSGANIFHGVDAVSASDVWAVGEWGDPSTGSHTLAEHWSGSTWSIEATPDQGVNPILFGVAAIASDDVWAVGYYQDNQSYKTLVEHWDGSVWTIVPSPNPASSFDMAQLVSVAAVSPTDVWAVGNYYLDGSTLTPEVGTLTEHWDGSSWTIVPSPNGGTAYRDGNRLTGVAAIATDDVWAVGTSVISAASSPNATLTEHWDGAAWAVVPSPTDPSGSLWAVTGTSPTSVVAVGDSSSATLIKQWDGTAWTVASSANWSGGENHLYSVDSLLDGTAWAVGSYDQSTVGTLIESNGLPDADLGIAMTATPDPIQVGSVLTYTMTVTNPSSSEAPNVVVTDSLPLGPSFISATASQGSCVGTTIVTCDLGSLSPGASATVQIDVTPQTKGSLTNEASAWALAGQDPNPNGNILSTTLEAVVQVLDTGFVPGDATLRNQTVRITWRLDPSDKSKHSIIDATGLSLFNSGPLSPGSSFSYGFNGAATYSVGDGGIHKGTVGVPMSISPSSGTVLTDFVITWAQRSPATGLVFDEQVKRPGSTKWSNLARGVSTTSLHFVADAGAGIYRFRGRLRRPATGRFTLWSAVASATVS